MNHEDMKNTKNRQITTESLGSGMARQALLTVISVSLWLALCAPARAQSFGPQLATVLITGQEGNPRFRLAAYLAAWDNPFRVEVRTFSPALNSLGLDPIVGRKFNLIGKTAASPLIEGSYAISPRWAVGFWYNSIQDHAPQRIVQIADVRLGLSLRRSADLGDLHVIYVGRGGLSAQIGYY